MYRYLATENMHFKRICKYIYDVVTDSEKYDQILECSPTEDLYRHAERLADMLYEDFHCRNVALQDDSFYDIRGSYSTEEIGVRIASSLGESVNRSVCNGTVIGRSLVFRAHGVVYSTENWASKVGSTASEDYQVDWPKVHLKISPGFISVLGDQYFTRPSPTQVRMYLRADSYDELVSSFSTIAKWLDASLFPWSGKIMSPQYARVRSDMAVFYLPKSVFGSLVKYIRHNKVLARPSSCQPSLFTRNLSDTSISYAYERNTVDLTGRPRSFGELRCYASALAILDACRKGDILNAAEEYASRYLIDSNYPWKNLPGAILWKR